MHVSQVHWFRLALLFNLKVVVEIKIPEATYKVHKHWVNACAIRLDEHRACLCLHACKEKFAQYFTRLHCINYSKCNSTVIFSQDFVNSKMHFALKLIPGCYRRKCSPQKVARFSWELIFPLLFLALSLQSVYKKWTRIALQEHNSELLFHTMCQIPQILFKPVTRTKYCC